MNRVPAYRTLLWALRMTQNLTKTLQKLATWLEDLLDDGSLNQTTRMDDETGKPIKRAQLP